MKSLYVLSTVVILLLAVRCSSFLDAKPDGSLVLPHTLRDLQALLDNESRMLDGYAVAGENGSDYYTLDDASWLSLFIEPRSTYIWAENTQQGGDWSNGYERIFYCNVVLDEVDAAAVGSLTEQHRQVIKGSALFFRGFTYLSLSQLFTPPYVSNMEDSPYGLPLKMHADIHEPLHRASVLETYTHILKDLSQAAALLPEQTVAAVRPSKTTAYAALARLHLQLGDYKLALEQVQKVLAKHSELIDYNTLDTTAEFPFARLNKEVLLHASMSTSKGMLKPYYAWVDSALLALYSPDDLRRSVLFRKDGNGFRFKGSMIQRYSPLFGGLAVDEMYLIAAECQVRLEQEGAARGMLNKLLATRWRSGTYIPVGLELSGHKLLARILEERRKQLCFRGGIRWPDLRRLNQDPQLAKTLYRNLMGKTYSLAPGDRRYTFLIPYTVIAKNNLMQNPR